MKISIGLFCFGTFSHGPLLEYLEKEYNIDAADIKQMRLSKDFVIHTTKGIVRIPLQEIEEHVMPSCGVCTDFTDELADISVGSAYPLEGWSTVIIRTKVGEELFNKAVEKEILKTQPIDDQPNVYERVIRAAMQKRTAGLKKAGELEKTYGYTFVSTIPLRETEALAHVKAQDVMTRDVVTVNEKLTIDKLLDLMLKKHHVGYPVLDEKGDLVGVVTLEQASQVDKGKRQETKVKQVMRKDVVKVLPGETGLDVFKKMTEYEIGRVVVVDPDNRSKLVGIVTKADLIETLLKQQA